MGQRTTLVLGGVEAEVSLLKTGGAPRQAQYEVRREGAEEEAGEKAAAVSANPFSVSPFSDEPEPASAPEPAPERATQRGVTVAGEWVDLTERLREIDEGVSLRGMEVAAAVNRPAVPAHLVRDSYYLASAGDGAAGVLAHLWAALRDTNMAALVRWTKRTNQALGAIVAAGARPSPGRAPGEPHLLLLELEWRENLRPLPEAARLGPAVAGVPERGRDAAADLLCALQRAPSVFGELRDERAGRRADLLEAVRRGERWDAPEPEPEPAAAAELRELLAAAS